MEVAGRETALKVVQKNSQKFLPLYRKLLPNIKNLTIKDTYFSYPSFTFVERGKILSLLLKMTME